MSEGRQLVLLLAGGLVLAVIGIVAATAFPEPCEEIEGIGTLDLTFVAAADALDLAPADAAAVEAVGERLGLGPWRGAVVLPADAEVLPSDFGHFAVTGTDLVALRPSVGIASAPRDVAGLTVVPVAGTSAGLVAADRTIAVIASDYERERCGTLPPEGDVLAVDRGLALLRTGEDSTAVWTLSGEELSTSTFPTEVLGGLVVDERVLVATEDAVVATPLRDGEPVEEIPVEDLQVLASTNGRLLVTGVVDGTGPPTLLDVTVADDGALDVTTVASPDGLVDAAPTPSGVVAATTSAVLTDRGGDVSLPPGVVPQEVVSSADGQVGVLVDGQDGRVLLVWGRDIDD